MFQGPTTAATPTTTTATNTSTQPSSVSASSSSSTSAQVINSTGITTHVGGVPVEFGHPVHINTKKQLQRQINGILGWQETDRAPMTIPQCFVRGNHHQINEHPYFVSEQSVGIRYLLILVQGHCYLVSQNYEIRSTILFAPVRPDRLQPGIDRNTIVPHQWTILDGLMVCDKEGPGKPSTLTVIVNDILAFNGTPLMSSKLQDRLKIVQNDVIGPRKTIPLPKGQPPDPFQLVQQYMYPVNRVNQVIRNIIPRVAQTRQNIGLLFTPVMLPYTPGYGKGMFSWTPATHLTIDLQLAVEWRGRPPTPGFKLMLHEKRSKLFLDWITFSPEEFEYFRQDKKVSSKIIECVYDPEWWTFIPSNDKTTWEGGSADFTSTERGQGWRRGGWRFVRCRSDRAMPIERQYLTLIEKAIGEDVHMEEIEQMFSEDSSKKPASNQPVKPRDPTQPQVQEDFVNKKKRGGPGSGVCYDFQNKGVCQRGRFCHFSHCACNSTCMCTSAKNTFGQRPSYRRSDYDAPPSPEGESSSDPTSTTQDKSVLDNDRDAKGLDSHMLDEEEAGELIDPVGSLNVSSVYAPLESFDKEALAAKRSQLTALGNRRIWASLGLDDKGPVRKRACGLVVSKSGEITIVRANDK